VSHGKFAPAPELVVKAFLSQQFASALLKTALSPIHIPIASAGSKTRRLLGSFSDLIKPLRF